MARKEQTHKAPEWFDPSAYDAAEGLDAGDWLLNLTLRRWLHEKPNPQTEAALRSAGPVLRRANRVQMKAMHDADRHRWVMTFTSDAWGGDYEMHVAFQDACNRPTLPADVLAALRTGKVRSGVSPLSVAGLYLFERMLPDEVRRAGAAFVPGAASPGAPRAFHGNLDDAFDPEPMHHTELGAAPPERAPTRQMVGRFVSIDLALPDDVLHADLQRYLAAERSRLAAMGGTQPYREAAALRRKAHELRTLATDGVLQYLDLWRWQHAEGLQLSFNAVRELAGIDRSRDGTLRGRVALTLNQMHLHAWFARLERSVDIRPRERPSAQ